MKQGITRRQAIEACVRKYIKNNPEEWILFKDQVAKKRLALADRQFGVAVDDVSAWKAGRNLDVMRHTITLPHKLAMSINTILLAHDNQLAFPENNNEEAWFVRTFPDFLVPDKY